ALHELYFGNLGGFRRAGPNSGLGRPRLARSARRSRPRRSRRTLAAPVRGVASSSERRSRWRAAQDGCSSPTRAGRSGSGTRSRRIHTQAAVDAAPVLVLDMYEHAYQMDFGVNATAYIDTFFRNINW